MESRGIPCGACRLLRRKCLKGCVFAPYFCTDEIGVSHFGAIHKVFGASNFSKMLIHLPEQKRYDAVVSVLFEAQARLQDPVYSCASHIYALQHQVANLRGELTLVYAQLASCSSLDGASLNPEYVNGKQSEMPSSISYSNSMSSPYDRKYFPLKSIPSENVSINNDRVEARDDERSWSSSSVCMKEKHSMSPICALATCHQTDAFQNAERSFEQKRMNNNDGDLETLAFNVIRGSCAPLTVVCPAILGTSVLFNQ